LSITKRVDEARKAFARRDKKAAAAAHTTERIRLAHEEKHGGFGSAYIGDIVYGGLDGIITTFAVISSVMGAGLETSIVLIMGIANLLADGFSMSAGAFLSTKSEQERYQSELEREQWEVDNFPEAERLELIEIYRQQGYSDSEAEQLVEIISRDGDRWVDRMMSDELGLEKSEGNPISNGLATFISFILFGVIPLSVYVVGLFVDIPLETAYPISILLTSLALFALGAAKVLVTDQSPFRSGLEMLAVGGLSAVVAYGIGALLEGFVN
jgi:VIT1/CCC1 family predicted Fe2+/Mn2+ transporter